MNEVEPILIDYLRRAYHAVDGLWFMMVEQATDFDRALELDKQVWNVLAKIHVRKARELLCCQANTTEDLARCFTLKLKADGHDFKSTTTADGVRFRIHACPWLELLQKSNRRDRASRVAQTICVTEGNVWCAEFGHEYEFTMPAMACTDSHYCDMVFARKIGNHLSP